MEAEWGRRTTTPKPPSLFDSVYPFVKWEQLYVPHNGWEPKFVNVCKDSQDF